MQRIKRIFRIVIPLLVAGALLVGARRLIMLRRAKLARAPVWGKEPFPVHVAAVKTGALDVKLAYVAVVEPVRAAAVSARLTSVVERVLVDEGDRVKAGQLLVSLDDREVRKAVAALEHQVEQARADLAANEASVASLKKSVAFWRREAKRDRELASRGSIPESQAEATEERANEYQGRLAAAENKTAALRQLVASIENQKAQQEVRLGYCRICSPFDGVVRRRRVDPGDLAAPGKPLVEIEDRSLLRLVFDVPQDDLERVRPGMPVVFRAADGERRATLTRLYPSLDAARMLRAEIDLDPSAARGLRPGAYVPLDVIAERFDEAALVPASALAPGPQGEQYVFAVRNGRLKPLPVKVLAVSGEQAAVEGVSPGEKVVTDTFLGWARLSSGIPVVVVE